MHTKIQRIKKLFSGTFLTVFLILSNCSIQASDIKSQDIKSGQFDEKTGKILVEINEQIKNKEYEHALEKINKLIAEDNSIAKLHLLKAKIIDLKGDSQKALDYLTTEIEKKPSSAGLIAARGQFLLSSGHLESAKNDFYKAYELNYRPVDVLAVLADIEQEKGNGKRALELLTQALNIDPKKDMLWFKKAQLELRLLSIPDAKKSCSKATELAPDNLKYHQLYIEILTFLKQRQELDEYTEKIHERFPGNAWISLRLSTLLVERSEFKKAKSVLMQALKSNENDYLLMFQMATILAAESKWEDSIAFFKAGLEYNPSSTWAKIQLSKVYLQTGEIEPAVEYLEKARAQKARDAFVYETLARIYNRRNETFEAERVILEGLNINDKNQTLILEYANLLEKRGNARETIKAYEEALINDSESTYILGKLGNLYRLSGEYEKSLQVLKRAISGNPTSTWIRAYEIETLADMEKWQDALVGINELLKIMPDDYWAYAKKALILHATDKFAEAHISITKAIKLRPDALWLREIEGRILERLHRYKEAEKAFTLALDQSPENVYLMTRLAYVQIYSNKNEALNTIKKALNTEDFDISTIELYLYLAGLAKTTWNFSENGQEYQVYKDIIYSLYHDAENGIKALKKQGSSHALFLEYFMKLMQKDKTAKITLDDVNLESIKSQWHCFYLGVQAVRTDQMEKARRYLEKGLELSPDNSWLMLKLAYVLQQQEKYDRAVDLLNRFFEIQTDNTYIWVQLRLALYYDLAKKYKDSERMYKKILAKKPDDNVALNNLAWMYLNAVDPELHKLNEALKLAIRAVGLQPSPANLDTLAEAYYQKKEYKKALKAIEQALDKDRRQLDDFKKTQKKILRAIEADEEVKSY